MRRVLVAIWGNQSADYVGRQLRLYRDPTVTWAGEAIGGIRIAAASHIDSKQRVYVQVKKGQKAAQEVEVLQARREASIEDARDAIAGAADLAALEKAWRSKAMAPFREQLQAEMDARKAALTPAAGDTTAQPDGGDYDGV